MGSQVPRQVMVRGRDILPVILVMGSRPWEGTEAGVEDFGPICWGECLGRRPGIGFTIRFSEDPAGEWDRAMGPTPGAWKISPFRPVIPQIPAIREVPAAILKGNPKKTSEPGETSEITIKEEPAPILAMMIRQVGPGVISGTPGGAISEAVRVLAGIFPAAAIPEGATPAAAILNRAPLPL
jgi:hypothetical protein